MKTAIALHQSIEHLNIEYLQKNAKTLNVSLREMLNCPAPISLWADSVLCRVMFRSKCLV